jgi:hypothetical protein
MRRTHAIHALIAGAHLTTVRDNLRHTSVATTSAYLHADQAKRARQTACTNLASGEALEKARMCTRPGERHFVSGGRPQLLRQAVDSVTQSAHDGFARKGRPRPER